VFRAVSGARDDAEDSAHPQRYADGSAKAALLGIDRSLAARRELDVQNERGLALTPPLGQPHGDAANRARPVPIQLS
jgi:hypothetical protein